jgi:F-box-like
MALPPPQELIYQILSFVPDNNTLYICSRVCRAWAPVAQGRLFETIVIRWKQEAAKFLELLKASPHIAKLPRLLSVREGRWSHKEPLRRGFPC